MVIDLLDGMASIVESLWDARIGISIYVAGSVAAATLIAGPIPGFFGRRGVATKLADYVGVAPRQVNIANAGWVHATVFPQSGRVSVPVSISDTPLKGALTAYYRHPAGVGSEEALHDFFANPEVVDYLTQPVSGLERALQVF